MINKLLNFFFLKKKRKPKLFPPSYRDRHRKRIFLIIGNGNTINTHKQVIENFILQYNPIIMASNNAPTYMSVNYHLFTNRSRFCKYSSKIQYSSKVLLSPYFTRKIIKENLNRDYEEISFIDRCIVENNKNQNFKIENGIINCNLRQIGILSIAIAYVMGAKKIFLAGLDGYDFNQNETFKTNFYGNDPDFLAEKFKEDYTDHYKKINEINVKYLNKLQNFFNSKNLVNYFQIITPTYYKEFFNKDF